MLTTRIAKKHRDAIEAFMAKYEATLATLPAVEVPVDMAVGSSLGNGWSNWRPVDSPVTDEDLDKIESAISARLPPLFRAYMSYKCLLLTDFGSVRLPRTPSNNPLEDFLGYMNLLEEEPYWRAHKYMPFGYDGNDGGPICFDTKHRDLEGDYPVVFIDHELASQDPNYAGEQRWDSFGQLLNMITTEMG